MASFVLIIFSLTRVNFTKILQEAFTRADPKSAKKTVKLSSFIALLGSARVKAARRMLLKSSEGVIDECASFEVLTSLAPEKQTGFEYERTRNKFNES